MKIASLTKEIKFEEGKPSINVLFETEMSREIRIAFKKGQLMSEHKTPFPIVVQVFKGAIDFGVNGERHNLKAGDLIALQGGVPHELLALDESIVRLSLSKKDSVERVRNVNTA